MDYTNNVDLNKYVISLDSLDFGLLPYTKFNNSPASLWSAHLLNTQGYFEFQVKPKTDEEIDDDDDDSTINNDIISTISENQSNTSPKSRREDTATTCHICDIDVPTAYLAEHENSLKHKAYVKIADVVLNRTRKHMLKKNNEYFPRNDSTYFCGSCASEVEIDSRQSHEKSKAHKQSVSLDRLLYELVALYTNDREDEEFCTLNKASYDVKLNASEVNNDDNDNTVLISDISARLDEFKIKTIENYKPDKTSQKDVTVNENNPDKHNESDSTGPNGFSEGSDHSNTSNTNGNQLLQSITGNKSKPIDSTKSDAFTKLDNETYLCTACNIKLHVNNIESHKNGIRHAVTSKSNVHYNMTLLVGSVNLLCRVCNIHVADDVNKVISHVATNDHAEKYTDLLKNNHVIEQLGNFYCKPCDLVIRKRNELLHIQKLSHETKLTCFQEKPVKLDVTQNFKINKADSNTALHAVSNTSSSNENVSSDIKPTSDDSKPPELKSFYCVICNVYIPNNPYNISTHNDGARHKSKAEKIIADLRTELKSELVSSDDESLEIHYEMDATDNEKNLMCKVCKVIVPNIGSSINEHVIGKKHDMAFKSILDANHIECVGEKYFCKYCKQDMKPQNIFKHINKITHKVLPGIQVDVKNTIANAIENFVPIENSRAKASTKDEETDDNSLDVTKDKELIEAQYQKFKYHFLELEDKKWLKCRICFDMEIPNTAENVASHTEGQTHTEGYKKLMSNNLILETEDRLMYLCAICVCLVPLKGEVQHANGGRHTAMNVKITLEETYCTVCDMDLKSIVNKSKHILFSPEHIDNLLKSQTLLHYCEYCKRLFSKDKVMQHEEECHKLAVKDKICFCTKCDPYLPGSSHKK